MTTAEIASGKEDTPSALAVTGSALRTTVTRSHRLRVTGLPLVSVAVKAGTLEKAYVSL